MVDRHAFTRDPGMIESVHSLCMGTGTLWSVPLQTQILIPTNILRLTHTAVES